MGPLKKNENGKKKKKSEAQKIGELKSRKVRK